MSDHNAIYVVLRQQCVDPMGQTEHDFYRKERAVFSLGLQFQADSHRAGLRGRCIGGAVVMVMAAHGRGNKGFYIHPQKLFTAVTE